jgi:hypothetical protein
MEASMSDADEYRRFADRCLGQAFQCENATEKKGLIQMAQTWALLADSRRPRTSATA